MNLIPLPAAGDDPAAALDRRITAARAALVAGELPHGARELRRLLALVDSSDALREERGRVCHHLCAAYGVAQAAERCDVFYRQARAAYGPNHPSLPALQNDRALPALLSGDYAAALEFLDPVREAVTAPCAAIILWGNLALSLAATGRLHEARALERDVARLVDDLPEAWPLACIARISYIAGDSVQTWRTKAQRARRVAHALGDAYTASAMVQLLR